MVRCRDSDDLEAGPEPKLESVPARPWPGRRGRAGPANNHYADSSPSFTSPGGKLTRHPRPSHYCPTGKPPASPSPRLVFRSFD